MSEGLFRTALACGMLVGVLAGACDVLIYSGMRRMGPVDYGTWTFFACINSFIYHSILMAGPAFYRRSAVLVLKSMACSVLLTGMFVFVPFLMLSSGMWWRSIWLVLLPMFFRAVLCGWFSARFYGYPSFRGQFIIAALAVSAVRAGIYFLMPLDMSRYSNPDGQFYVTAEAMARLITSVFMGMALAWPVEKLERERTLANESGEGE